MSSANVTVPQFGGIPPFPTNVPTHPLLVIDYELLKRHDEKEIERLWEAGTKLGFWYLKNHGAEKEVDGMFEMGKETMSLPLEEKMKYEQGDSGRSFGYKAAGANAVDAYGTLDTVEFLNVSKDDVLSYPTPTNRTYPLTVNARMEGTIRPFIQKSSQVNNTILEVFNDKLGLPKGTLLGRHRGDERSGSETRVIKSPPLKNSNDATNGNTNREKEKGDVRQAIGAHTDFGSLSFLHNRLGGLQVLVPGCEEWQYVKPIPGHAICNIGDAIALFSGGILRSNLHRVVPPPGAQGDYERWSLVFFTRPGNSVILRALVEDSEMVRNAVNRATAKANGNGKETTVPQKAPVTFETGSTAEEWFARRVRNQRINNRTGPETWIASRGTEQIEV
ncbi:Clavaminate synthase-like protein [Pluteus cervinus]|uniref:Clavaminate synthase-like protein n=1 Tax=Pluteus cervinus TaxID=181527 RepID=A0ACD3A9E4_9AGAR|nr:Clavaminate synthase-like protein [Pluteus cervinus]